MKHLLLCLFIIITFRLLSQTEGTIILVTNAAAEIFMDGDNLGAVTANEAKKIVAAEGEHFIQAKSNGITVDETVAFEAGKQKVVKLNFETEEKKNADVNASSLYVADMKLYLPGGLTSESSYDVQYYAFDTGDEIVIDMKILDGKGNANLIIKSYPNGSVVFSEKDFREMTQKKVRIPEKGIYKFLFYTDHVFDRNAHVKIKRIPSSESSPTFSTVVKMKKDTIYHDVLNTNVKVYGKNNPEYNNKTSVKINLPENTSYWVYWIGVGQESSKKMEALSSELSGSKVSNPIAAYGLRSIPSLPQYSSSATVNYRFFDNLNIKSFKANAEYKYLVFKQGSNVTADFALIKTIPSELNFGFWNISNTTHDVNVKVGAFVIQRKYYMEE